MTKSTHRTLAGFIVLIAWFAALAGGLLWHDYEGLQLVTPVMLIYAGYLFGDVYFTKKQTEADDE